MPLLSEESKRAGPANCVVTRTARGMAALQRKRQRQRRRPRETRRDADSAPEASGTNSDGEKNEVVRAPGICDLCCVVTRAALRAAPTEFCLLAAEVTAILAAISQPIECLKENP